MNVVVIPAIHQTEDSDCPDAEGDYQFNEQSRNLQVADATVLDFPGNKNAVLILFANDFCHLVGWAESD